VIWTNLFRDEFNLSQPGANYVLDEAWLEVWSDNKSRWYVNGDHVGDGLQDSGVVTIDIMAYVQPGDNLLAVQSGNDHTDSETNPANLMGTAWRVWVSWDDVGTQSPVLNSEPLYTPGTGNTISWSPITVVDDVTYVVTRATNSALTQNVVTATTTSTSFTFTGLEDGQIYYYQVIGRNPWGWTSGSSNTVSSTQDATLPTSSMGSLPAYSGASF